MDLNKQDEYEKKHEVSFITPIFLFFACSLSLVIYSQGLIPSDNMVFFLVLVGFGYFYAVASTIYKLKSSNWMYNLRSQLSITYFIFISLLFTMVLTTILFVTGSLILLFLLFALWALELFFVYRLLMFYEDRLNYLSDQYKNRIEEKIKEEADIFLK
jgi:Mn2+/Fe2+ NRAMP family transporter